VARCDPNDAIPRTCADAFGRVTERLARIEATGKAIHEQTVRTNGHVTELFRRTNRHETAIRLLRADVSAAAKGRSTWGRRIWQVVIGLALLLAGYLLKS
jgi:hypothetical protein